MMDETDKNGRDVLKYISIKHERFHIKNYFQPEKGRKIAKKTHIFDAFG